MFVMTMATAKVFETGRSQAVRLPKEFRFDTDEVYIAREDGKVVLIPKPKITWAEFFADAEPCPDFVLDREGNGAAQEREPF